MFKLICSLNVYMSSVKMKNLGIGEETMDEEKAKEKAIRKRVKRRRYKGKYKGRGKYKQKEPA
jgi:hypothetical protein